jgi:hypothetical protein
MVERSDSRTCGRWERDEGDRTRSGRGVDGDGVDREGDIWLRKSGSRKGGIFVDLRTGGDEK